MLTNNRGLLRQVLVINTPVLLGVILSVNREKIGVISSSHKVG